MEIQMIIRLIAALAQTAQALAPQVEKALVVLQSHDADQIKAALAELRAAGDALHDRVHAKLGVATHETQSG